MLPLPAFDDAYELSFKCSSSDLKNEIGHKDCRPNEDECEEHDLLPCVKFTEIDGVQASVRRVSKTSGHVKHEASGAGMTTHASVMALTQRNKASVNSTWVSVEEAQKMTAAKRQVNMK